MRRRSLAASPGGGRSLLAGFVASALAICAGPCGARAQTPVAFEQVLLPETQGARYTTVAVGPDGKLYGVELEGGIRRWPILPDGTLGDTDALSALTDAESGPRLAIGFAFDPAATSDSLVAWVSHSWNGLTNIADWGGKVSRLSGPDLETVQDFVVGLPRSFRDHSTNGVEFGPDGAIYFLQGSNTAMGAPDAAWGMRPERLLNGALLRFAPEAISDPPLDVRTEEGGTYDPYAPGAPLTIHASGIRNAYDLVFHSNGSLYVPTNGSAQGGNTPAGSPGAVCSDGAFYAGPDVPGLTNVSLQSDYLFRVEQGGYYGHPNPTRCEFVMNGGNPTSGADPAEVAAYPVGTEPDANWRGFAHDFGLHFSPDGAIEYRSDRFDGGLRGSLLVCRYSNGNDILAIRVDEAGSVVETRSGIPGFSGFLDPLDLTEDPRNGNLYVSEFGGLRVRLLRPLDGRPPPSPEDVRDLLLGLLGASPDLDRSGDGALDAADLSTALGED